MRFIRDNKASPFFLYLAHTMPHVPLFASSRFAGRSDGGLYGDVVETIDWSTGEILDVLEEEGLADNTIVIFTSDNGPWTAMPDRMLRENKVQRWDAGSAGPLRGSKGTTWEGGMRMPFIAYWPRRIPPGQASAELATSMDLFTTLVELAGGSVPSDRPIDGKNIMDVLAGRAGSPHEYFYYFQGRRLKAIRDRQWKLRVRRGDHGDTVSAELFNLRIDPYERFDVAEKNPEIVARLADRGLAFVQGTRRTNDSSGR